VADREAWVKSARQQLDTGASAPGLRSAETTCCCGREKGRSGFGLLRFPQESSVPTLLPLMAIRQVT